ncbi:MAG TPA: hypothetical protein VL944_02450 [Candidatus Acidoferrum sp.]|nr:hypothetical protein [Candidatus Acidoferrum sp.]
MSSKLKLSPRVSYLLGIYSANRKEMPYIGIRTKNSHMTEKFIKTAIEELGILPNKILLDEEGAHFYNSKLKKLFEKALERRMKTFKYLNDYSGNYVAGLFDCNGGMDKKGMYLRNIDVHDGLLLENLGMHTKVQGSKSYIMNEKAFVSFIKEYSSRLH